MWCVPPPRLDALFTPGKGKVPFASQGVVSLKPCEHKLSCCVPWPCIRTSRLVPLDPTLATASRICSPQVSPRKLRLEAAGASNSPTSGMGVGAGKNE